MRHPAQTKNGNKSWTYYKYDAMNRQVMTGEIEDARSRSALQDQLDAYTDEGKRYEIRQNNDLGYSRSRTFPYNNSKNTVYTISYFDDYKFITYQNWDSEGHNYEYNAPGELTIKDQSHDFILGKTTGSKVRVIGDNQETWLNSVVYYDNQGRVVQTVSENHVGGTDRLSNELTWEGELRQMLIEHTGAENTKVLREYYYDRLGQLVKTYQTINPGTQNSERVLLAAYDYNILGELKEKRLHSLDETSFIQAITYDYNFQGALTQINNPSVSSIFAAQFNYEDAVTIGSTPTIPRFDGMMTSQIWRSNEVGGTKHATGYAYDGQNRLDHTTYGVGTGSTYNSSSGHFSMDVSYEDDNANIHSITRNKDGSPIDDLTYYYEPNTNKLKDVDDAGTDEGFDEGAVDLETEYTYDAAGNMTADGNKQITAIEYNHLQLVSRIEFFDFTEILYTYDAVGNRLSKEVRKRAEAGGDPKTIAKVDYVGVIEYLDGEVNQVFTDEGRAYKQNDKFHYEYFITDHQANNRVAFGDLPERDVYTATMESHRSGYEESHFAFPANIRTPVADNVNHTPLGDESIWLNGTNANRRLGLAKVLDIHTGDEVDISAWAKYTEADGTGTVDGVIATILATLGLSSTDNAGGEALFNHLSGGGGGTFVPISDPGDPFDAPDAYIAYLFFDDTYTFDPSYSGFLPVTSNSLDEFEQLKLVAPLKIEANGSLFIYMANETAENQEVYFDDLKIDHSSAIRSFKVTQVNEFYPFGLPTSNSWRAPGYVDPGLLYQYSYSSYDTITGFNDFFLRNYDPILGRWAQVDPYGQFSSPYNGMSNLPHLGVDPDGGFVFPPILPGLIKLLIAMKGSTFLGTVTVTTAKVGAAATVAKVAAVTGAAYVGGTAATGGITPNYANATTWSPEAQHVLQYGEYGKAYSNTPTINGSSYTQHPTLENVASRPADLGLNPIENAFNLNPPSTRWKLSAYQPSFAMKWSQSSYLIAKTLYGVADGLFVLSSFFTPWREPTHLNGVWATPNERATAFGGTALSAMMVGFPAARGGRAGIGSLKNISGSLDDAARLARNQPHGPNTNIFRRLPRSAQDARALREAQAGAGRNLNIRLGDPRYQGWQKWHHSVGQKGSKSVVHYLRNPRTGFRTDFKFK